MKDKKSNQITCHFKMRYKTRLFLIYTRTFVFYKKMKTVSCFTPLSKKSLLTLFSYLCPFNAIV